VNGGDGNRKEIMSPIEVVLLILAVLFMLASTKFHNDEDDIDSDDEVDDGYP